MSHHVRDGRRNARPGAPGRSATPGWARRRFRTGRGWRAPPRSVVPCGASRAPGLSRAPRLNFTLTVSSILAERVNVPGARWPQDAGAPWHVCAGERRGEGERIEDHPLDDTSFKSKLTKTELACGRQCAARYTKFMIEPVRVASREEFARPRVGGQSRRGWCGRDGAATRTGRCAATPAGERSGSAGE